MLTISTHHRSRYFTYILVFSVSITSSGLDVYACDFGFVMLAKDGEFYKRTTISLEGRSEWNSFTDSPAPC